MKESNSQELQYTINEIQLIKEQLEEQDNQKLQYNYKSRSIRITCSEKYCQHAITFKLKKLNSKNYYIDLEKTQRFHNHHLYVQDFILNKQKEYLQYKKSLIQSLYQQNPDMTPSELRNYMVQENQIDSYLFSHQNIFSQKLKKKFDNIIISINHQKIQNQDNNIENFKTFQ